MYFAALSREVRKIYPDIGDGKIIRIILKEGLGELVEGQPKLKTYSDDDIKVIIDKLS